MTLKWKRNFPEEIWTMFTWNWKPVCWQWAILTHKLKIWWSRFGAQTHPIPFYYSLAFQSLYTCMSSIWFFCVSFVHVQLYMILSLPSFQATHFKFDASCCNTMNSNGPPWFLTHYSFLFISVCPSGSLYIQPVSLYAY